MLFAVEQWIIVVESLVNAKQFPSGARQANLKFLTLIRLP